jgi:hypothetical protein
MTSMSAVATPELQATDTSRQWFSGLLSGEQEQS